MEGALSKSDYLLGASLSLADFCVLPALIRMEDLGYDFLWADMPGGSCLAEAHKRPGRPSKRLITQARSFRNNTRAFRDEHQAKRQVALTQPAA